MTTDDERRDVAKRLRGLRPGACFNDVYEALGAYGPSPYESRCLSATGLASRLADLIEPPPRCPHYMHTCCRTDVGGDYIDRDALLALTDEMERKASNWDVTQGDVPLVHTGYLMGYADRIREALGVSA